VARWRPRPGPDAFPAGKGAGVLQGAQQYLGVGQRHLGLAEGDAAGLGQRQHFGQHLALQVAGQRAQREYTRGVEFFGTKAQHLHQAGLVQHRVGIGRAHHARHAACHGRRQLGCQHARVLVTRLAQAHRQVQKTGCDDAAGGVDGFVSGKACGRGPDSEDLSVANGYIGIAIKSASGVYDAATPDQDVHEAASAV
jgi:hypothetical protein